MISKAVNELEKRLLKLSDISYKSIDTLMKKIMKKYDVTAKELHYGFKNIYNKTPDRWIKEKMKTQNEEFDHKINPKEHKKKQRENKIRTMTSSPNKHEVKVAKSKLKGPSLPFEQITLVQKILGEEKCGKGMYWCNTDKECKPVPSGFNVPGQSKIPKEVGLGKNVDGTKSKEISCSHTEEGSSCPIHGKNKCPISENKKVETTLKEATRIKSQTGNIIGVTVSWRGKYYYLQLFFPELRMPSRSEVATQIQKIYPDSRVISYRISTLDSNTPIVKIAKEEIELPPTSQKDLLKKQQKAVKRVDANIDGFVDDSDFKTGPYGAFIPRMDWEGKLYSDLKVKNS